MPSLPSHRRGAARCDGAARTPPRRNRPPPNRRQSFRPPSKNSEGAAPPRAWGTLRQEILRGLVEVLTMPRHLPAGGRALGCRGRLVGVDVAGRPELLRRGARRTASGRCQLPPDRLSDEERHTTRLPASSSVEWEPNDSRRFRLVPHGPPRSGVLCRLLPPLGLPPAPSSPQPPPPAAASPPRVRSRRWPASHPPTHPPAVSCEVEGNTSVRG